MASRDAVRCRIEQAAVTVGHEFVGFFGGGVQGNRVIDVVMDGKGHVGVGAVDGTGGGKDQVPNVAVAAAFQDV